MSIIKEVGLPNRPPPMMSEDGRDLSERAPPPRSSSPVIGSPPVRAVPIGTPPKQPMSHAMNHQQQVSEKIRPFLPFFSNHSGLLSHLSVCRILPLIFKIVICPSQCSFV